MSDPLPTILNCLKNEGIDDADVDLFLGVIAGNAELVKNAIAKGANVRITDKQLVSKYRDVLEKTCSNALKEFEGNFKNL